MLGGEVVCARTTEAVCTSRAGRRAQEGNGAYDGGVVDNCIAQTAQGRGGQGRSGGCGNTSRKASDETYSESRECACLSGGG